MRLSCKRGMQIAVYSAMFGRTQQGTLECPLHHRRAPSVGEAHSYCHVAVAKEAALVSKDQELVYRDEANIRWCHDLSIHKVEVCIVELNWGCIMKLVLE